MKMKRRKFFKIAAGTGIGAIVTGCAKDGQKPAGRVSLRQLGRTDIQITPVGFGAQHTRDSDLIRYAIDRGVNYIETAWGYGFGKPGNSPEAVGKAISGIRDKVYLFVAYTGKARPTSKGWVANQFEQTLRDLGTDYIDVFLWHQPDSIEEITKGEHIDLMEKLSFNGRIKAHSLAFYCKRFGIPHDDTLKGEDMPALAVAGEWEKIRAHVLDDVTSTYLLAQRLGYC